MPYDQKMEKARRENPNVEKYYIHPIFTFRELESRVQMLRSTKVKFCKKAKEATEKSNKVISKSPILKD